MVAGEAAAIDSVATLGAGPAALFVVAVPARRLRLASFVQVTSAVGIHKAICGIEQPAVVLITCRGDEWEEREQKA